MSLIALVRPPSARAPLDFTLAKAQHAGYVRALHDAGVKTVEVPAARDLPDAVFIEDSGLILDSLAVLGRSGTEVRRDETFVVTAMLSRYCYLVRPPPAVCFEGGDVLTIDRTVYIGRSERTNAAAVEYLTTLLRQHYYEVVAIPVTGCLHLKSGVTSLGENMVLINPQWVPREKFAKYLQIEVSASEPAAANALRVGNHLFMSASYPRTAQRVEDHGLIPKLIDIGEFHRCERGLTCLSLLVNPSMAS